MIRLKRDYEPPAAEDGLRILVERLWPRGVSKQRAALDLWLRDIAPSPELREWYSHDPAKWPQFRRRYSAELRHHGDLVALLKLAVKGRTVKKGGIARSYSKSFSSARVNESAFIRAALLRRLKIG